MIARTGWMVPMRAGGPGYVTSISSPSDASIAARSSGGEVELADGSKVLVDRLAPDAGNGFLSSLLVSFLGACVLLGTLRLLGIGESRRPAGHPRLGHRRR